MRLDTAKVKNLCLRKRTTLDGLLRNAGVSRNAYYTLARKKSVLSKSIRMLADFLDVPASALMEETPAPSERAKALLKQVDQIARGNRGVSRENVRHSLLLLRERPFDRLRRALLRAQKFDFR